MILENKQSLAKDAADLDDQKRAELKTSIAAIDLRGLGQAERKNIRAWCDSLTGILDKPPAPGFDAGARSVEPMKKCMAVLSNYDITGTMAKEDGHQQLVDKIDILQGMAKAIVLVKCGQDIDALEKVPAVIRHFIEYFCIYEVLGGSEDRNAFAQSALLAMQPATFEDQATKPSFEALHKALLQLSHGSHGSAKSAGEQAALERNVPLLEFCEIVNKGKITSDDVEKGGAKQLVKLVQQFRDIGEKKGK